MFEYVDDEVNFGILKGKIITEIKINSRAIIWNAGDEKFAMYHYLDCCEQVSVEDIHGDLKDMLNSPVLRAEKRESAKTWFEDRDLDKMWTFYEIATIKGSVTIRWFGTSNGCYSTAVSFKKYVDALDELEDFDMLDDLEEV